LVKNLPGQTGIAGVFRSLSKPNTDSIHERYHGDTDSETTEQLDHWNSLGTKRFLAALARWALLGRVPRQD
jgi:hypothetical protein